MKKEQATGKITDRLIREVTQKLRDGKEIRLELPGGGLLHIDRPLPFLVVFRRRPDEEDRAMSLLVRTQASYLIASGSGQQEKLQALVRAIAKAVSNTCGAFLIVELWPAQQPADRDGRAPAEGSTGPGGGTSSPAVSSADFIIRAPAEVSFTSIGYLKENLEKFRPGYLYSTAEIVIGDRHPPGLPQLLDADELKEMEALLIGLEIRSFYLDPATGLPYPLLLRKLARSLSEALQRTFFEFVRIQTKFEVSHFRMLGRRLVTRPSLEVDESLARINDSFRFLLLVTPINIQDAWQTFRRSGFEKKPVFHYRLMPVDPEVLKRELYNIPVEQVEDPTLAFLFREKRGELDKMLTLLSERGKPGFMPGSMQYYGPLEASTMRLADNLLSVIPANANGSMNGTISPWDFAELARREIAYYRRGHAQLNAKVHVQDDIAGLVVSKGDLYIGTDANISAARANALIQHEVGTHILTYYNGRAQPLRLLYCGMPGYEELQEGLAVLSEYLVGGLNPARLRLLAARVAAVQAIIRGADFIETFKLIHNELGYNARLAFTITMRVYRGGGLTKDAIYLQGLVRVLSWLANGNELEPLLIGKIREKYVPLIKELLYRKVLQPAPLRPRYLNHAGAGSKLEELKSGKSALDLLYL